MKRQRSGLAIHETGLDGQHGGRGMSGASQAMDIGVDQPCSVLGVSPHEASLSLKQSKFNLVDSIHGRAFQLRPVSRITFVSNPPLKGKTTDTRPEGHHLL